MQDIKDSLGIPNFGPWYLNLLPNQDSLEELLKLERLFCSLIDSNTITELNGDVIDIKFINYGMTQLVFVVTVDNSKQYTLIVNQPATKYGTGKKEFDNLNKLNKLDSNLVIKPMYYYDENNYELYMTPYHYQARCIGVDTNNWGIWIPDIRYHFKEFKKQEKKIINSAMVSILVKLYDEENNKGLAKCRLDGGDFMLLKGFEKDEMSIFNIFNNIKLIAARELISISFEEYVSRLKTELSNNTLKDDEMIIIDKNLRQILTDEEIENGIKLGMTLRNQEKEKILKRIYK